MSALSRPKSWDALPPSAEGERAQERTGAETGADKKNKNGKKAEGSAAGKAGEGQEKGKGRTGWGKEGEGEGGTDRGKGGGRTEGCEKGPERNALRPSMEMSTG